jgi:hypothetical protein
MPDAHIERDEFERELRALIDNSEFRRLAEGLSTEGENTTDARLSATWLSQLVNQAPVDAEFAALDLDVTDEARRRATEEAPARFGFADEFDDQGNFTGGEGKVFAKFPKWFRERLIERQARLRTLIEYYQSPTPEKARRFFERFGDDYCARRVSHILVTDEADARQLLERIRGGDSFGSVARAESTDTGSAQNDGVLGCLTRGQYVKEFEDAAYAAPIGEVTEPVKTQFGFHLILTEPTRYEELEQQIGQSLGQGIAIDLLLKAMTVRTDPRYGAVQQAAEGGFQINPPTAPDPRTQRERSESSDIPFPNPSPNPGG